MGEFDKILNSLQNKQFAPVYFLHGEEPYFIDQITDYIEEHALTESEKSFNQQVFYGKDVEMKQLIAAARRFPMMANYQVIIVKEAQNLKGLDELQQYLDNPLKSTILVFAYKNKKLDKRTKIATALKSQVLFESKKLYDNELPNFINSAVARKSLKINSRACMLMAEYLGADLTKVANEIDKLFLNKKPGEEITEQDIETHVGISKEYNVFELQSAIAVNNKSKAFKIANHFAADSKNYPLVVILGSLYSFFSKVFRAGSLQDRSKKNLMSSIGLNYFQADDCVAALQHFPGHKLENIFSLLKEYDLRSKGINDSGTEDGQLLKEMLFRIFQ